MQPMPSLTGRGAGHRLLVQLLALAVVSPVAVARSGQLMGMPQPFTRVLRQSYPLMNGSDVVILQNLLRRHVGVAGLKVTGAYDSQTTHGVERLQTDKHLDGPAGVFGNEEALALLQCCSHDGYVDDGAAPAADGYMYKVHVRVMTNRSAESNATLYAANGTALFTFRVRAHGHSNTDANTTWPDFTDDVGINQFTSMGNTPTGLMTFDLNSPEDEPEYYGPYPVNRAVVGLRGNAGFLLPTLRNGILMHTGSWGRGWRPPMAMPNSEGCLHAWPASIERVWHLLVALGVRVNNNTNGHTPYPYRPQGLLSVEAIPAY